MKDFITIKTTKEVQKLIRTACALTGEHQYELLKIILLKELDK